MSRQIFEINWEQDFHLDRIMVSANSNDACINIGIKDSVNSRAAWYELDDKEQIALVSAILENLRNKGVQINK